MNTLPLNDYAQSVQQFSGSVSRRLLAWSVLSMLGGALLWRQGSPFARGFGIQAVVWGAIDALIAGGGLLAQHRSPAPLTLESGERQAAKLRRLLWFNALLDVGYVIGGLWLARTKGQSDAHWRGHGWGIVVQGKFLFWFDLYHALRVPKQGNTR
jgi:hypothetical protein